MSELYISTDIETDGPIPGPNSMLSFGSAAFKPDKTLVGTFTANLILLPGAAPDVKTQAFWDRNPTAYAATRTELQTPEAAMRNYVDWVENAANAYGAPVFVAYPAGFDFLFMYWYMIRFAGRSPFSFSALDIKTFSMAVLKRPYRNSVKKNWPTRWFDPVHRHSHIALEDAIEQGQEFCNMLAENHSRPELSVT